MGLCPLGLYHVTSKNTTGKKLAEITGPTLAKGGFPVLSSQNLPMVQKSNHWQSIYFIKMLLVCLKKFAIRGSRVRSLAQAKILFVIFLYFLMFFIHKMYFFCVWKRSFKTNFFLFLPTLASCFQQTVCQC